MGVQCTFFLAESESPGNLFAGLAFPLRQRSGQRRPCWKLSASPALV